MQDNNGEENLAITEVSPYIFPHANHYVERLSSQPFGRLTSIVKWQEKEHGI
jgi:hypothetical protein